MINQIKGEIAAPNEIPLKIGFFELKIEGTTVKSSIFVKDSNLYSTVIRLVWSSTDLIQNDLAFAFSESYALSKQTQSINELFAGR